MVQFSAKNLYQMLMSSPFCSVLRSVPKPNSLFNLSSKLMGIFLKSGLLSLAAVIKEAVRHYRHHHK